MEKKPEHVADNENALSDEQLDLVVGGVNAVVQSATVGRESSMKLGRSIGREDPIKNPINLGDKINLP